MVKKISLCIIITLSLIAFIASYWMKMDSTKKLAAIQERFRESGAPMEIAEFLPDAVADELNAAPLYLELEALMEEFDCSDAIYAQLIDVSDHEIEFEDIVTLQITDEEWRIVEDVLGDERLVPQLMLIEQIVERPFYRPNWMYHEGPAMLVPELSVARSAEDYLSVLAARALRSGDASAANKYLNQMIDLSHHMEQGPILISYLTALAIRGNASEFLESASVWLEDATVFDSSTWQHDSHVCWNASLDSERLGMGKVIFEGIINGDYSAWEKFTGEPAPAKFKVTSLSTVASYFRYDYIYYLEFLEAERFSEDPFYQGYADRSRALEEEMFPDGVLSYLHVLSRILTPALGKVREVVFKSDTQNVVNHTALQLARYQGDTGVYPDTLEVLVPAYCEVVPLDLFSGEPLIYRKEGMGFALYSVGPNMKDDGGVTNHLGSADDTFGDVIWAGAGSALTRIQCD